MVKRETLERHTIRERERDVEDSAADFAVSYPNDSAVAAALFSFGPSSRPKVFGGVITGNLDLRGRAERAARRAKRNAAIFRSSLPVSEWPRLRNEFGKNRGGGIIREAAGGDPQDRSRRIRLPGVLVGYACCESLSPFNGVFLTISWMLISLPYGILFYVFRFRWKQQFRRRYPDEVLSKADAKGKGDYKIDYEPAPRITEADMANDRSSLKRALDSRLYLLLYGITIGSPDELCWHFPEKLYESEESLRECAERALKSVIGDLSHTYFVGNAPMGHMSVQPSEALPTLPSLKRFFFKSQVVGADKYRIGKCKDFAWVTKDELIEHFPQQSAFFNQMIIS